MDCGIRIDQQADSIAQKRLMLLHERRRETIVGGFGVTPHEVHRGAKWRAPILRGAGIDAASAVRAPSSNAIRTHPRTRRRTLERADSGVTRQIVGALRH